MMESKGESLYVVHDKLIIGLIEALYSLDQEKFETAAGKIVEAWLRMKPFHRKQAMTWVRHKRQLLSGSYSPLTKSWCEFLDWMMVNQDLGRPDKCSFVRRKLNKPDPDDDSIEMI